ncbi:hypothetical protein GBAR_LOCUS10098 [Geodia barretti]|uniref:Uncharacterized protein n=1 Tax=Geodia barretti TaxID=519541 RepID=A0AA35WDD8_GEOBA|nr:hypothetical protein GBAR_LOCUS10098 [Geodia barretti]
MSMQTAKDVGIPGRSLGNKSDAFQKEFLSHWHPPQRVPTLLGPWRPKFWRTLAGRHGAVSWDGGGGSQGEKVAVARVRQTRQRKNMPCPSSWVL